MEEHNMIVSSSPAPTWNVKKGQVGEGGEEVHEIQFLTPYIWGKMVLLKGTTKTEDTIKKDKEMAGRKKKKKTKTKKYQPEERHVSDGHSFWSECQQQYSTQYCYGVRTRC